MIKQTFWLFCFNLRRELFVIFLSWKVTANLVNVLLLVEVVITVLFVQTGFL